MILLPGSQSSARGFSALHPSPFAFLAAGNSKVLPSAPDHAGMLQMRSRTCKSPPCSGRHQMDHLAERQQVLPSLLRQEHSASASLPSSSLSTCNQAGLEAVLLLSWKVPPSLPAPVLGRGFRSGRGRSSEPGLTSSPSRAIPEQRAGWEGPQGAAMKSSVAPCAPCEAPGSEATALEALELCQEGPGVSAAVCSLH